MEGVGPFLVEPFLFFLLSCEITTREFTHMRNLDGSGKLVKGPFDSFWWGHGLDGKVFFTTVLIESKPRFQFVIETTNFRSKKHFREIETMVLISVLIKVFWNQNHGFNHLENGN